MGSFWVFGTILGAEKREDVKDNISKKKRENRKKTGSGGQNFYARFF